MSKKRTPTSIIALVFKAVALAMGVAVIALYVLDELDSERSHVMLAVGLTCLALTSLAKS